MKRFLIVSILLFLSLFYVRGYAEEIPQGDISLHIQSLSSERFAGRLSGTAGGRGAGEYIAGEFKKIGLLPAATGSYFQPFNITVKKIGKDNQLSISKKHLRIFEDYVSLTVCASGEVSGEGVLTGGKIQPIDTPSPSGEKGRGERGLSDGDLHGKIAILRFDESAREGWLTSKIKEMEESGAAALLILKKDLYSDYTVWEEWIPPRHRIRWERTHGEDLPHLLKMKVAQRGNLTVPVSAKIPCVMVREDRMSQLLRDEIPMSHGLSGEHENVIARRPKADEAISKPGHEIASHPSDTRNDKGALFADEISIKVDIMEERIPAKNVIGYLPAKGDHKDEVVIIGAHYDHLGLDSKGNRFPGADDNASGVSAMLDVAKRLAGKAPLKRSVVFIAFDGEEWGLTGSRYYTDHSAFPLEKTILMINMDTIGRNEPDAVHFLGSLRSPDVRKAAGEIVDGTGIKLLNDIEFAFKYGSDHYPFYEKGVPAIDLTSSYHEDFHRITDTPEKINVDKVSKIADLVYRLALETADSGIYFQKPLSVEIPFPGR